MGEDFDFGFSTVSEEDFKIREVEAAKRAADKINNEDKKKAQRVFDAIMPLLENLQKDADVREYIYWPGRKEKISSFIKKLKSIIDSD